jgi:hypothetical protein
MTDVLPSWFPHPRFDRDRTGGAGLLSEFGVNIPQVRLWSFQCGTTGATRGNLASPAFRGPGVIRDITSFAYADGSAVQASVFTIRVSTSPAVTANGLAVTVTPPGVIIYDLGFLPVFGFSAPREPGIILPGVAAHQEPQQMIGRVVTDSTFFLNLSYIGTSAAAGQGRQGVIRIYENVDPDLVAGLVLA